jgi:hypothetical protein
MNLTTKRVATILASGTVAVAASGIAFAYWSTTGGGTGSASAQAVADAVVVHQTSTIASLSPGSPAQAVAGTIENTSYASETITGLTFVVTDTTNAACTATDFTVVQPTSVATTILTDDSSAFSGGSVAMKDTAPNACKGVTVHLTYTVV